MRSITGSIPAFALAVVVLAGGGCASTGGLREARTAYDHGRFSVAENTAAEAADATSGQDRDEAVWLAGVSAYRGGDFKSALDHLSTASRSENPIIAGRAHATLGLIHLAENRLAPAAAAFRSAALRLAGEEGAIAARRGASLYSQLNRPDQAASLRRLAVSKSEEGTESPVGEAGFTVQLGAFSTRENAEEAARSIRSVAARAGFGAPRVTAAERGGRLLHLVQVGAFETRYEAELARHRLGATDAIVASAAW